MLESKPVTIMLYVADICNLNCSYCYNIFPRTSKILSLEPTIKFLKMHNSIFKRPINLKLIGGEPTIYSGFLQMLEMIRDECNFIMEIDVFTNFTADTKIYLKAIDLGVNLAISYHSQCGFDFAAKLLKFCNRSNSIAEIAMMFEPGKQHEFAEVLKKIIKPFRNVIRVWPLYTKFGLVEYTEEEKKFFNFALKILYQHEGLSIQKIQAEYTSSYFGHRCSAGYDSLYVYSDGNAYRCQNDFFYDKTPIFNIYTVTMQECLDVCQPKICECVICRHGNFDVEIQ